MLPTSSMTSKTHLHQPDFDYSGRLQYYSHYSSTSRCSALLFHLRRSLDSRIRKDVRLIPAARREFRDHCTLGTRLEPMGRSWHNRVLFSGFSNHFVNHLLVVLAPRRWHGF